MFRATVIRTAQSQSGLTTIVALTVGLPPRKAGHFHTGGFNKLKTEQSSPGLVLLQLKWQRRRCATETGIHQPEDGSISGNVYTNDFFEFTFPNFQWAGSFRPMGVPRRSIEEPGTATANKGNFGDKGNP